LDYPWRSYKAYASGAVDDLLDQRALLGQFSKIPFRARKELVRFVKSRLGEGKREEFYKARRLTGYFLKSVAGHFGRDPVAISQGEGKLELRLREDEDLGKRITELAENLAKGRKRILI